MAATDQTVPDFDAFERYYSGQMSSAEQRLLEGKMLDEPLVAEAYEGFLTWRATHKDSAAVRKDLSERLHTRVSHAQRRILPLWAYASAASVLLAMFVWWFVFVEKQDIELQNNTAVAVGKKTTIPPERTSAPAVIRPTEAPKLAALPPTSKPQVADATSHPQALIQSNAASSAEVIADDEIIREEETDIALAEPAQAGSQPMQVAPEPANALSAPASAQAVGKSMAARIKSAPSALQTVSEKNVDTNARSLDEVTVTGRSEVAFKKSDAAFPAPLSSDTPVPADGWEAYRAYLDKNTAKSPVSGQIVVTFIVSSTGTLSGFTARGDEKLQKEAIRIVREGPAWIPASAGGNRVAAVKELRLQFRQTQ
jgi:hypothetical protein